MTNKLNENTFNFFSQLENLAEIPLIHQFSQIQMVQVQDQSLETSPKDSYDNILGDLINHSTTMDSFDSNQDSHIMNNSSQTLKTRRVNRTHLARPRRRRKNNKSKIQQDITGYWTKNFLPIGKNPHFKWIIKQKGAEFLLENPDINEIKEKFGISMDDYIYLYSHKSLQETWQQFFKCKYLHREVMLSRAEGKSKIVFFKFLHRFEQAYITGVFDHIA